MLKQGSYAECIFLLIIFLFWQELYYFLHWTLYSIYSVPSRRRRKHTIPSLYLSAAVCLMRGNGCGRSWEGLLPALLTTRFWWRALEWTWWPWLNLSGSRRWCKVSSFEKLFLACQSLDPGVAILENLVSSEWSAVIKSECSACNVARKLVKNRLYLTCCWQQSARSVPTISYTRNPMYVAVKGQTLLKSSLSDCLS